MQEQQVTYEMKSVCLALTLATGEIMAPFCKSIIIVLFRQHGGATGWAKDMSAGALAPVGPRVEPPLIT